MSQIICKTFSFPNEIVLMTIIVKRSIRYVYSNRYNIHPV